MTRLYRSGAVSLVALFVMFAISTLAVLGAAGPARALPFTWQSYNFGATPFDSNNNWSPVNYPNGIGHQPSPGQLGENGEKFDLEGLFVAVDDSAIHIALTNSFGTSAYSTGWSQSFGLGDLFIGVNGTSFAYALRFADSGLWSVSSSNGITNRPGTYFNNPAIRNQVGPWTIASGTRLGDVGFSITYWPGLESNPIPGGNGNTYILEWTIDRSLLPTLSAGDTLYLHNTLECGNDLIETSYLIPSGTSPAAVPEPSTFALLLPGLAILAALRSRSR